MTSEEKLMSLTQGINKARSELKNLRQQLETVRRVYRKDVLNIEKLLEGAKVKECSSQPQPLAGSRAISEDDLLHMKAIGRLKSVFGTRNGTPRQSGICPGAKAELTIDKSLFTNPEHSLEGLDQYTHVWVIFLFHLNKNSHCRAKVKPPRLNGKKVGLFSTRCPYRPNALGLTLAKLEGVRGATMYLSGVDIVDDTPVLDIKPYIPQYDQPSATASEGTESKDSTQDGEIDDNEGEETQHDSEGLSTVAEGECAAQVLPMSSQAKLVSSHNECIDIDEQHTRTSTGNTVNAGTSSIADWVTAPPIAALDVTFTLRALSGLEQCAASRDPDLDPSSLQDIVARDTRLIRDILHEDPRSVYRRTKCQDRLYFFTVADLHVTSWFDDESHTVEVLKVKLVKSEEK